MPISPCLHQDGRGVEPPAHQALFYRSDEDYLDGVLRFIAPGLEAGEPIAVAEAAATAGLERVRAEDLVLAVNEVATNTLKHAGFPGRVRVWNTPEAVICQVEDPGHIADPLAGRHAPRPSVDGGLGRWMVNQLCDLVEVRTGTGGTTIRLHMSRFA